MVYVSCTAAVCITLQMRVSVAVMRIHIKWLSRNDSMSLNLSPFADVLMIDVTPLQCTN